jgi:hypothetical protein
VSAEGFRVFAGLTDVVPGADHKATGEERAWGRRLAKRFGCEGRIDDRTFVLNGDGCESGGFDFGGPKVKTPEGVVPLFELVDPSNGGRLVAFGWAMAEDLAGSKLGGH